MQKPPRPLSSAEPCHHTDRNDRLFAQLYRELRQLAQRALQRTPGAIISPTTVLHEAYLDISSREPFFFRPGALPGICGARHAA